MAADVVGEDFVTIVPVGESRPAPKESPETRSTFVTVLTVGAAAGAAEVVVRRPRGARLGLGLKFEGGSAAAEKVRRLLVQSCAEDSPAANAIAPWGKLIPGDEILAIDGISVAELTRIDCVRRLKDSDEKLTLLVRHFETTSDSEKEKTMVDSTTSGKQTTDITRPTTLPPPVPPRKLGKKNSFKDKQTLQTVGEQNGIFCTSGHEKDNILINGQQNGAASNFTKLSRKSSFDSHIHRQGKEGIAYLKKGSPEEVRRLVRRLSDGKTMPPDAEVYIDLLSTEWERCLALADAESDDTGSSISTVVDRLGSMANSVENSIPSTPTMQPKTIDIQKVLNCIENIDSNILNDISSQRFLEKDKFDIKDDSKLKDKNMNIKSISHQETLKKITVLSDDITTSVKKLESNDKNNNNTILHSTVERSEICKTTEKVEIKTETAVEKPKPMPRNTKIERSVSEKKSRPIPIPAVPPPPVPEPLLTPTKKNCIETWLQRSEAEMKNKPPEKLEEAPAPEVLPRLIDFVPKTHYKESSDSAPVLPRPTTAPPPPPPPTDPREDGSGASLDTIGDFDETCDVTDNAKPAVIENETRDRKSTFDSSFWEDRVNKSDAEDKSLSNDETPLPTCPRQPPDGVETPADAVENAPELPSRLPPRLPAGWPTTRTRYSYTSRTQDARSEASVKDKIAMFSNDRAPSSDQLDSCGTLPKNLTAPRKTSYTNNYNEVQSLDRRLTKSQDNLDEVPRSYKIHSERPEVLGAIESKARTSSKEAAQNCSPRPMDSKPLFYGSTTTLPSNIEKTFSQPVYHARSISDDNGDKSVHKSNLEYLIEQRKKSLSKLRGLVIPEVQSPIVDLPEIKVQDNLSKSFIYKSNPHTNINNKEITTSHKKIIDLNETNWKTNLLPNNLPKYSPAFKRKSLQVYTPSSLSKESTPERKFNEKVDALNKLNSKTFAPRPARTTSDAKTGTLPAKFSMINLSKGSSTDYKSILSNRDYKNVEIKICTATEIVDSDNDSAMSSTQSSYRSSASSPLHNLDSIESDSSRLSPRISHYTTYSIVKTEIPAKSVISEKTCEEYVKRNVCRSVSSDTNVSLSSSAGSAATSGSQASCSSLESSVADSDKRKVSKSCNIDTINRRNILASAKCRSGRDAKLKSPVVETKFTHESYEKSPSPTRNASERLSTLTSSVSAISNKGDSRRRNKVIAETDSDSDQEVNVRQRKADFKNSRLKRNSSSANKNKPSEVVVETAKVEDPPKVISETIIKEIKKSGLNSFNIDNNKMVKQVDKTIVQDTKHDVIPTLREKTILKSTTPSSLNGRSNLPMKENLHYKLSNGNGFLSDKSELSSLEESKLPTQIVRLQKGASSGVGLILAGGIDCEAKDVTVHRVLADSVAAKAGLKRGAKIRSINNCSMVGLTHAQTVAILKEQRTEVVIETENDIQDNTSSVTCGSDNAESKARYEGDAENARGSVVTVLLDKAGGGAGLGFGLDGGRDSPQGDRPLTVKKLFAGGAAAQSGRILVGAELLSAGGTSMEGFTRTQAWAALKALPAGPVTLVLRNPVGK
ncbi:uncharacterized protein LOC125225266 isoform X2 [Leguminivora glycinivorella]|uniref:uncharacterized protein LOC125225266 isoform X1 n=1 Tax=Leguminivora glycinivorella TaxID=1035111 RepID=UPI00200BAAC5|nr:uncharacterized protein LOC125225266 isoform X1 [Leguminivora glycinivorella]XP_047984836.1 uncharacterized protein LOC125225266 isoform X2 [Leguminivora glycinivorella]